MRTRKQKVILMCVLAAVIVVGALALRGSGGDATPTGDASRQEPPSVSLAPAQQISIAEPAVRAESGARHAAVRFLELTEQVSSMTPRQAADAQRAISSTRSADRLAAEVESKLTSIQAQVPDGLKLYVAPVAVRSRPTGDGWEVAVWYVQVSVLGREIAAERWSTATYTLLWEHDEWRMDTLVSTPGPTPTRPASTTATPTAMLIAALAEFNDEGLVP